MAQLVNSIEIEAPAEAIFDYASDLMNEREWGEVLRVERLEVGPIGAGTTFLAEWKGSGPIQVRVIAFERPRRWSTIGRSTKMDVNLTGEVIPLAECKSRFTATMELVPHGALRLLTPILVRVMQKTEEKNLAALKRAIERRRAASVVHSR